MDKPLLVLVGGFLGAGKTSLIRKATEVLQKRGMRIAVILNDQDAGLVDSSFMRANHIMSGEVAGGCFCCRFSDLLEVSQSLLRYQPDVIFAEPVGSCIDLAATLVHPLKLYHGGEYRVAPITVLIDPSSAEQVFAGEADPDIDYLFRKQIEEADILCASRSDLRSPPQLMMPIEFNLSSRSGQNVEPWLEEVLHGKRVAGSRILDVDYSRYADAEAALGWLNFHVKVRLTCRLSPASVAGPLMEQICERMLKLKARIAHLKVFDRAPSGYIKASICGGGTEPEIEGDLMADPAIEHEIAVNLRAVADPAELFQIVSSTLNSIDGELEILHQKSFRPLPPQPEYRMVGQDILPATHSH